MSLSPEQQILVSVYGGGDYAHITSACEAQDAGDTLFLFLMLELAPDGDTDRAEYVRRMDRAMHDVLDVLEALQQCSP
jgi:hypothetical protein